MEEKQVVILGAEPILILGESGSGKTSSFRDLPPDKTFMIIPGNKGIPLPGAEKNYSKVLNNLYNTSLITDVGKVLIQAAAAYPDKKYFIVEDLNHYFNARTTSASFIAQNSGGAAFSKWNLFAADVIQSVFMAASKMPKDCYVIIVMHSTMKDNGIIGPMTSGKLLENDLYIPGYTNYVLHSLLRGDAKDPDYKFLTNADGIHLAKSPMGCLNKIVANNMYTILQDIEVYKKGESKIQVKWKE